MLRHQSEVRNANCCHQRPSALQSCQRAQTDVTSNIAHEEHSHTVITAYNSCYIGLKHALRSGAASVAVLVNCILTLIPYAKVQLSER